MTRKQNPAIGTTDSKRQRPRRIVMALAVVGAVLAATLGPATAQAQGAPELVINEIHYHPSCTVNYTPCADDTTEFIELHNHGVADIDLTGWAFNDGVEFSFDATTIIPAGGYLTIADDAARFTQAFGQNPFGQWTGELSNGGERIALVNAAGMIVDEITYSDGSGTPGAWSVDADGNGDSLSLMSATDADGSSFWWDSATPSPNSVNANAGQSPTAVVENFVWSVLPTADQPIQVSADIYGADTPVLQYRINYPGTDVSVPMNNVAGDTWQATVPASAYGAGDLVRFRIRNGSVVVAPRANDSIDYVGTTVADPGVSPAIPVIEWFTSDANYNLGYAEQGDTMYDGVLAYNGVAYDNVTFRIRGVIARNSNWTKRNWKFKMPEGHDFEIDGISYGLDSIDFQGGFADEARIREYVGHTVAEQMGLVASQVQHVHIRKNGQFFGLHTMQEHPEGGFLKDNGLPNATLYKTVQLNYEAGPNRGAATTVGWETWDIPEYINLLAAASILQHNDFAHGNFYAWYDRDEHERQEGMIWDLDLSQGIRYAPNQGLTVLLENGNTWSYVWHRWKSQAPIFNQGLQAPYRQLYLRRLRTLADEWYGTGRLEQLARATFGEITGANGGHNLWQLDTQKWGFWGGQNYTQTAAINRHSDSWIDQYYAHIRAGGPNGDIPSPQPANPNLEIFVDAAPADQRNEHIRIKNNENVAIDISGWQIGGSATATLPPGSVLPSNGSAYVVDNDLLAGFRAVTTNLYVLGEYHAPLNDLGGDIALTDPNGTEHASLTWGAGAPPAGLILNEWNAVSTGNFLLNGDVTLGTIAGNGGDWFELVVTEDNLDIRGWGLTIFDDGALNTTLTFSQDELWADLRAGTIITVAEEQIIDANGVVWGEDVAYNPPANDWWIHVVAGTGGSGVYITADSFRVSDDSWQMSIYDAADVRRFGPAGEGIGALANGGISSTQIGELEQDPSSTITPSSAYSDGDESTFGLPNGYVGGPQDFDSLRPEVSYPGDVSCDVDMSIVDALFIAQYTVGNRFDVAACPVEATHELNAAAGDLNGDLTTDIVDAMLIAQCTVQIVHDYCPPD